MRFFFVTRRIHKLTNVHRHRVYRQTLNEYVWLNTFTTPAIIIFSLKYQKHRLVWAPICMSRRSCGACPFQFSSHSSLIHENTLLLHMKSIEIRKVISFMLRIHSIGRKRSFWSQKDTCTSLILFSQTKKTAHIWKLSTDWNELNCVLDH